MEVNAQDIIDSVDLTRKEVLMPIYESVVNSIISIGKTNNPDKTINVFIERNVNNSPTLNFDRDRVETIQNVLIVDNGEGFTEANFKSFQQPFSKYNRKYGCKGVGRFTILALFERMEIASIYYENQQWYKRSFVFDATTEISKVETQIWDGEQRHQTTVKLLNCNNKQLLPYTAKSALEIAQGVMEHCFIYYLGGMLPKIYINEKNDEDKWDAYVVNDLFKKASKENEKEFKLCNYDFKLYVVKSTQVTSRKYNYVTLCANSRTVGGKRDLGKYDSLYTYPITNGDEAMYLDVYVVSAYLDEHVNNQRTGFKMPEEETVLDSPMEVEETEVSIEALMKKIAEVLSTLYESYAVETKKRTIAEVKEYITKEAPQYSSFLYRKDILDIVPPNLTDDRKEEFLHKIAYQENKKITEKINQFIATKEVNENQIIEIVESIKNSTAYNTDTLAEYVFRRKAIIRLFGRMLDQMENGRYELEKMIHNIIFPMGLTNRQLEYQYHNLWLLDDRFSTYRFIASDKSITSFSQIKSSKEPDLIMLDNEEHLVENPISFGTNDSGEVTSMVVFEFKRPGETAHQKKVSDNRWEFSDLVKDYFETFLFGEEKEKKNYRGNTVTITRDTPKFGYVILDVMPLELISYNEYNGWRKSPFGSYYKIIAEQNMHLEAITYKNLLRNAEKRNNPFFDQLFVHNVEDF